MKHINKVIAYVLIAIMTLSYGLETKQLKSYAQDEKLETEVMDSDDSVDNQVMTVSDAEIYEEDVTDEEIDADAKIKVLFIGNSKTFYNSVPALVNNLASKKGLSFTWDAMTYSSRTLKGHYTELKKAINGDADAVGAYVDFYKNKIVVAGSYDVVVLQEKTGRSLETKVDDYLSGARMVLKLLRDNGFITQKTPIVINSIWGEFSETGLDFTKKTITKECWDDYLQQNKTIDMHSTAVRDYLKTGTKPDESEANAAKYTNVQVANTGVAFNKYLSDKFCDAEKLTTSQRYTVANRLILLDKGDANHAQVRGSYLEACVLLQAISVGLKQSGRINDSVTFDSYVAYDGLVKNYVTRLDGKTNYETTTPNYSKHDKPVTVDEATYQKMQRTANGMVNNNYTRWYKNKSGYSYYKYGCRQLGWVKIDGKYYSFDSHGIQKTGWQKKATKWFYYDTTGSIAIAWEKINDKWYYFSSDGEMETGWHKIDGKWYYFVSDGAMVTGWKMIKEKCYYFNSNGSMVTGWKKIDGKWYYFNSDGIRVTGWKKINGKWYYFVSGGEMVTGLVEINEKWYYFNSDGEMVIGWQKIDGKWYYFSSDGAMIRNQTIVINGVEYTFDSTGVWVM